MRVLHINKFGWGKGGSEIYLQRVTKALVAEGVEVGVFAGAPIEPSDGVVPYPVEIPDFHDAKGLQKATAAGHVLWAPGVRRLLSDVVDAFRPDVAHLHLYAHQFSPSIIDLLARRSIPTVMTAHDFKLVCPAYLAVRRDKDCFDCARHLSVHAMRDRCLHGSLSWTATAVAESKLVRSRKLVANTLVAPSEFMARTLRESWLDGVASIRLLRNPAMSSGAEWRGDGGYVLYVGRLSPEKGVDELITWCERLDRRLVVAGAGPEAERLEKHAEAISADVTFLGHVDEKELSAARTGAMAQVVPSSWPENAPLAALEAAVDGVPLIVADRGGLREIIELGARGAVLRAPTEAAFAEALGVVTQGDSDLERLRAALSMDHHITALTGIYHDVIDN